MFARQSLSEALIVRPELRVVLIEPLKFGVLISLALAKEPTDTIKTRLASNGISFDVYVFMNFSPEHECGKLITNF